MTPLKLRIVEAARRDLAAIRAWLTQPGSGRRGYVRYAAVISAMLDLRTAPQRWPFGDITGVRERPVEGHRIFYRLYEDAEIVEILRVFGPYQDRSLTL